MSRAISGMSRALFDSDLIATRLALFLAEALWATMLFWPGDTFERPAYSAMGQYAPEVVWACAFGVSAVLQLSIVLYQQCAAMWARLFAIWNAALWLAAVVLMIAGVYPPPAAIGGEIALAVSAVWIAARPLYFLRWERLHAVQR